MARVRVLYVDFTAHFGGAILSLADLLPHLREVGVEPFLLAFQPPQRIRDLFPEVEVETRRAHLNYVTRAAVQRFTGRVPLPEIVRTGVRTAYNALDFVYGFRLSSLIRRSIRRNRIDILHMNNGLNVNALRAAAAAQIPSVAHMRGVPTRNTAHILATASRHVESSLRGVIAVSEAARRAGIEHGLDGDRMVTIHNPIDIAGFDAARALRCETRRRLGFEDHHVVAAAFGRVTRFKGQGEFLEAAAALVDSAPELRLLIVGDASDSPEPEYWDGLRRRAAEPPLRGRVVFSGYQEDPRPFYHASDIVVHSALGAEGFGRVLVEGMAASKAVIASDAGGPRDIITDGIDGLLVPPGDVEGLRSAIRRLVLDEGERERLASAGRATARRFAPEEMAREVATFYGELDELG